MRAVVGIALVVLVTTLLLVIREGVNPLRASLIVVLLLAGNTSLLDIGARSADTQVVLAMAVYARILIAAIVVASIMDVLLRARLPMLYPRRAKKMKDHVILCGLGRVGFRVFEELQRFDAAVTVIEADASNSHVSELADMGVPVVIDDAKKPYVLMKAGLEHAKAVIACTDDDLTNVEVALDAREIRPDIRIVTRLYDQQFARKITRGFDIQVAFSSSALAAPAFAAAAVDPTVMDTFYVDDRLYVFSEFWVPQGSKLSDISMWDLWGLYAVRILSYADRAGKRHWDPSPTVKLPAGAKVSMVGPYDRVQALQIDTGIIEGTDAVAREEPQQGRHAPVQYARAQVYLDPGR